MKSPVIFIESEEPMYSASLEFRYVTKWERVKGEMIEVVVLVNVFVNGHFVMRIEPRKRFEVENRFRVMLADFAI